MQYCILIRRHPDRHEYVVEALGYETQSGYPRFARKFGADRFIRATIEGIPKHSVRYCETKTEPIYWLGRKWICMRSRRDAAGNKKLGNGVGEQGPANTTHMDPNRGPGKIDRDTKRWKHRSRSDAVVLTLHVNIVQII